MERRHSTPGRYIATMAVPTLDFWFEFASTYSYPAAMRIAPLAKVAGVTVHWRPFVLGPIFKAQGWTTSPFNLYPAKGRNMWRDLERICGALRSAIRAAGILLRKILCWLRASRWSDLPRVGARTIAAPSIASNSAKAAILRETETIAEVLTKLGQDAGAVLTRAQSDEIKSQASCKHRGGPVARYIWLPELCHHQRRAVLGQ